MMIATTTMTAAWSQKLQAQGEDHHIPGTRTSNKGFYHQHLSMLHVGLGEQMAGWACCRAASAQTHPHLRRGLGLQRKTVTDDERDAIRVTAAAARSILYTSRR